MSAPASTRRLRRPEFYACDICGALHRTSWNGDCRQDDARFFADVLNEKFGPLGWDEVEIPDEQVLPN